MKADRRAISALYGAFAVVLVSTVVMGVVLAGARSAGPPQTFSADGKTADLFLAALLRSTAPDGSTSFEDALSRLCLRVPCADAEFETLAIADHASALAGPLAHSLDRHWSLAVERGSVALIRAGDLQGGAPAVASRADIYHDGSYEILTVTLRLAPR